MKESKKGQITIPFIIYACLALIVFSKVGLPLLGIAVDGARDNNASVDVMFFLATISWAIPLMILTSVIIYATFNR